MEGINASGVLLVKLERLRLVRHGGARMVPAGGEERPQGHPAGPGDTGVPRGGCRMWAEGKQHQRIPSALPVWMLGCWGQSWGKSWGKS